MPTVELTTNLLAEIGGWPALKEARGLVERGRVRDARREGDTIRATVQGAEKTHQPQLVLADRVSNVEVRCTCAESRKTGRVCPHVLAAGLAVLQAGEPAVVGTTAPARGPAPATSKVRRLPVEDASPDTPRLELTILLPLQLSEALAKDPVRIILEARLNNDAPTNLSITSSAA